MYGLQIPQNKLELQHLESANLRLGGNTTAAQIQILRPETTQESLKQVGIEFTKL